MRDIYGLDDFYIDKRHQLFILTHFHVDKVEGIAVNSYLKNALWNGYSVP